MVDPHGAKVKIQALEGGEWVDLEVADFAGGGAVTQSGNWNLQAAYGKTITRVAIAQGAAGTTALASADASNKHKLIAVFLTMDAAGTLKFTDGVADLTGAMDVAQYGGFVIPPAPVYLPWFETGAVNRALNIVTVTGKAKGIALLVTEA